MWDRAVSTHCVMLFQGRAVSPRLQTFKALFQLHRKTEVCPSRRRGRDFGELSPPNKAPPPKLKYEAL